MILQALYEYAKRENLGDLNFEDVEIKWLVRITKAGKFSGLERLSGKGNERKDKGKVFSCPYTEPAELHSGGKTHFLYDAIQKVIVWSEKKWKPGELGKMKKCQKYFVQLVSDGAGAGSKNLKSLKTFFENEGEIEKLREKLGAENGIKSSDKVMFAVGEEVVVDDQDAREYWINQRKSSVEEKPYVCLVTGKPTEGCETVGSIKGLPGGNPTGSPMISYDKDSFESYALEKSFNAAMSHEAEAKIRAGLQKLLNDGLYQSESKFIWWTREKADFNPLSLINDADPEKVSGLMRSIHDGKKRHGLDANLFYAMSLSGNGGRLVVRDWIEQRLEDIQQAIGLWFSQLALVDENGLPAPHPKLWELLNTLTVSSQKQKTSDLPPRYFSELVHSALSGRTISFGVYAAACRRQQLEERKLDLKRMALIKIFLLRSRSKNKEANLMMTENLNKDLKDPAYLCGRIFAVFDRLQYLALEGLNAGVVERFYAAACTTPALVMGRLFRNAQFHLAKLKQTKGGAAWNIEKDFEALAGVLGNTWPATLDLEGQGRFALGYYHQRAEYAKLSQERKNVVTKEEGK